MHFCDRVPKMRTFVTLPDLLVPSYGLYGVPTTVGDRSPAQTGDLRSGSHLDPLLQVVFS
jgi:hypothetical protein